MNVDRVLDQFVPISEAEGDWERVLADAQREPTRHVRALGLGVPVLAAALVAIVALAWPFESEPPTVLARALAAIGDGPVIHVVTRGEWGGTQIDLRSGEITPQFAETEVWYDPDRGLHYVSRLGDRVVTDHLEAVGPAADRSAEQYIALADRYRDALRAGRARVVATGRVEGRAVYWIRIRGRWFPDVGDGKNHLLAEEVAVDRDTYEPVYTRSTLDGRPAPGGGSLLLELERLPAGEGDFSADPSSDPRGVYGGAALTENLTPRELARALGGRAVWLGDSFAGLPLVETRRITFKQRRRPTDPWQTTQGVSLFYGSLHPRRGGIRLRDDSQPFVQLLQATEASPRWPSWRGGISGLREGLLLVDATGTGFVRHNGVYVSISSRSARRVLGAAVAVRSVGASAPPRTGLDLDRLAKALEERRAHTVRTEGGAPVEPRAIVKRGRRVIQAGETRGVTLRIYPPGVAVVDTRRMERSLQRSIPETLSWHCFRVLRRDLYPQSGGSGPIPRSGVKTAVVLASPSRRNRRRAPVPLRPPYDGCELGTGYGRNWLPRFDWHGPLEIALTERGSRYFEERAAARELAHFVRNGTRRQARIRMKAGADAPSAVRLADPDRPYIEVRSSGDRFRASLTASSGHRFFIEIVRGRIGPKNVGLPLAFVR